MMKNGSGNLRPYLLLILLAILVSFTAGYLALSFRNPPASVHEEIAPQLNTLKAAFFSQHTSDMTLDISSLVPGVAQKELMDPDSHLPATVRYDYKELRALFDYSRTCRNLGHNSAHGALFKAWTWHRHLCEKRSVLPESFFSSAPFMHPSGSSYVALAYQHERDVSSLLKRIAWAHVQELSSFPKELGISADRKELGAFDSSGLRALLSVSELVASKNHLFVRDSGGSSLYRGYPLNEALAYFEKKAFRPKIGEYDPGCLIQEGNICWSYNLDRLYRKISRWTLLSLCAALALTGALVWLILRRISDQRNEDERRRFALQTLTHELRTPITSMRLSSETVRDHFDAMPAGAQVAWLRILDDLQRLQRLTDASTQYLRADTANGLIQFNMQRFPSLHELVTRMCEPYRDRIQIEHPVADGPISVDGYWLNLCLKNLIENSLQHGKSPITVKCSRGAQAVIEVSDHGESRASSLQEMSEPFSRSGQSQGLGLGLSIVSRVMDALGGQLQYSPHPTTFRLVISQEDA